MKYVINKCFGGFGLSEKAEQRYEELTGKTFESWNVPRNDSILIKVVEELGDEANGKYASLCIVDIPSDIDVELSNYDGAETLHEIHRSW